MDDNKTLIYKQQIGEFTNNLYKQVIGEYSTTANVYHVLSRIVK